MDGWIDWWMALIAFFKFIYIYIALVWSDVACIHWMDGWHISSHPQQAALVFERPLNVVLGLKDLRVCLPGNLFDVCVCAYVTWKLFWSKQSILPNPVSRPFLQYLPLQSLIIPVSRPFLQYPPLQMLLIPALRPFLQYLPLQICEHMWFVYCRVNLCCSVAALFCSQLPRSCTPRVKARGSLAVVFCCSDSLSLLIVP